MKTQEKSNTLYEELDAIFAVSSEAFEGEGEDSFCCSCSDEAALIGVFDGCGGLGARQYDKYEGHTGAYIASRLASGAVYDWFQGKKKKNSCDSSSKELKIKVSKALSQGKSMGGSTLKLRGSMVRDFPSTASIVLVQHTSEKTSIEAIWAGDSRIYLLDKKGLSPISIDDTDSHDALEDLRQDPVQTNVLSSDGNFTLHTRSAEIRGPLVVIASTDGYFGYWQTPMHFEYFLLDTLERADSLAAWKTNMCTEIQEVTGDDATLAAMLFRFGTFEALKKHFRDRLEYLRKCYIQPLMDSYTEEKAREHWLEYRKGYERFMS